MNHDETRDRKLLLNKREIKSISKKTIDKGITIVPLKIFELNGKFKMKIAVVPSTFLPLVGGAEIQTHNTANKLAELGNEVDVFLLEKTKISNKKTTRKKKS